jgi:hypothetical protein
VGSESRPPPSEKAAQTTAIPARKHAIHCAEDLRLLDPNPEETTSHDFGRPCVVDVAQRLIPPPVHRGKDLPHELLPATDLELCKHLPSAEGDRRSPPPAMPRPRDKQAEYAPQSVRVDLHDFLEKTDPRLVTLVGDRRWLIRRFALIEREAAKVNQNGLEFVLCQRDHRKLRGDGRAIVAGTVRILHWPFRVAFPAPHKKSEFSKTGHQANALWVE